MINSLPGRNPRRKPRNSVARSAGFREVELIQMRRDTLGHALASAVAGYSSRVTAHRGCISRILCYCISLHRTGRGAPVAAYLAAANR